MKLRNLILSGALAIASLSVVSAKSHDIVITEVTQAGDLQLKPGEYKLKLDGNNAVFTNVETGKSFTTAVKVQHSGTKHDATAVDSTSADGGNKVQSIELGGSDTVLEFGAE